MTQKNNDNDDVIIEAEIITEKPQKDKPTDTKAQATIGQAVPVEDTKNTAARIGWGVALLLIAFVSGIFMEPFAEQGLKRMGLIKEEPSKETVSIDLSPLNEAQLQHQKRITALESAINAQNGIISSLKAENATLSRDMTTLAAGLPTGAQETIPPQALLDITSQIKTLEAGLLRVESDTTEIQTDSSAVERLSGELKLARAESAQLLERLKIFEQSYEVSQSQKLSNSAEGRAAVTLHHLYLNATSGADYSADIAALKPELSNVPLLDIQKVSSALSVLEANQRGIATHSEIVQGFNDLIPSLLKANISADSNGWWTNLFTVRRTDARAEGVEAVIRTIETHLINRDLTAANTTVSNLPVDMQVHTKVWQNQLIARENTLSALTSLLNTLSGDSS